MLPKLRIDTRKLNPGQRQFLASASPYLQFAGGYGTGKTTVLCCKILQLAKVNRGYPGIIVAPTWTVLKSTVLRGLRQMLMRSGVPRKQIKRIMHIHGKEERYLDWGGGTHIFVRSAHNPDSIDGLDAAWVAGDENRYYSKDANTVIFSRTRIKKAPLVQRAFTSTPSMGPMYDEFATGKENRQLIVSSTEENAHNLDENYIADLRRSYSPRLQRAVIEGQFTVLEGAVYEAFDPKPDSPWFIDYEQQKARLDFQRSFLWMDPGYRHTSVVWVRQIDNLKWCIFHQMHPDGQSVAQTVRQINAWNRLNNVRIDEIWIDPAADSNEQATAISVRQVVDGIECRGREPVRWVSGIFRGIAYGVEKVRMLLGDPDEGMPIRLFFSKSLLESEAKTNRGVIRSLSAYRYPEMKDGRQTTDTPLKDGTFDHACDCVRYGGVGLWLTNPELSKGDRELDGIGSARAASIHSRG